jgi:membrane protein DedA with SNARE-associated domain
MHIGTFLWGLILTAAGAALAAVGFGWWDLDAIDLRYAAPVLVILIGAVILLSALTPRRRSRSDSDLPA